LRNFGNQLGAQNEVPDTYRVAGNYVTGSHAFKVGFTLRRGRSINEQGQDNAISYRLTNSVNGIPNQITEYANARTINDHKADLGVFVQDQWTTKRLTVNAGLRYDYFNGSVPAQQVPATRFLPAR